MLVLALDTTTRSGSLALAVDGRVVLEFTGDAGLSQAQRLPGDVQTLLSRAGRTLREVDIFTVAVGPGSFTGLRVGIATMQGLAFACDQPLIGVSALDALAMLARESAAQPPPQIATWVDAWRGEVYAALYRNGLEVESATVEPPDQIVSRLAGPTLLIGDGVPAHVDVVRSAMGEAALFAPILAPPLAGAMARLATVRAAAGDRPAADAVRPLYVRRPDAEIARDARAAR